MNELNTKETRIVKGNELGKRYIVLASYDNCKYWSVDFRLNLTREEARQSIEDRADITHYCIYEITLPIDTKAEDVSDSVWLASYMFLGGKLIIPYSNTE